MITYLCPCPLNLVDGMRMGSSSLSSESWWARAGWLWPSSPSSPGGSALLQPPDVSSSGWLLSSGADAAAPPSEEPSAGPWADELPRGTEQEASQGGSVEAAGTVCCPEDSEGAEGKRRHTFRTIFTVVSGTHAGELCVYINSMQTDYGSPVHVFCVLFICSFLTSDQWTVFLLVPKLNSKLTHPDHYLFSPVLMYVF